MDSLINYAYTGKYICSELSVTLNYLYAGVLQLEERITKMACRPVGSVI